MHPGARIDYKALRNINPEAARLAVLEYLNTNGRNVADTARVFGITRPVVYDILKKQAEGDLKDRSRVPIHQPNRTAVEIEQKVIEAKRKTRLGPQRLSIFLAKYEQVHVAAGTIRHILRRNRPILADAAPKARRRRDPREFVDWYHAQPFEVVQMDIKHIRDQKALTKEQIIHLDLHAIPNYQWGALDVSSRFKLVAYSRQKSWTNGLCFYLWVISWLRSNGVTAQIVFTVDNGEEFGGKSWLKVKELRKLIAGFGCRLIQNHKGHPEENAHIERSDRTDDDEFYRLRAMALNSEKDLLEEAMGYIYYNNVREHSSLDFQTPFAYLKHAQPHLDDSIRYAQPFILDNVSVALGPWSGYNVLAQHPFPAGRRAAPAPHPDRRPVSPSGPLAARFGGGGSRRIGTPGSGPDQRPAALPRDPSLIVPRQCQQLLSCGLVGTGRMPEHHGVSWLIGRPIGEADGIGPNGHAVVQCVAAFDQHKRVQAGLYGLSPMVAGTRLFGFPVQNERPAVLTEHRQIDADGQLLPADRDAASDFRQAAAGWQDDPMTLPGVPPILHAFRYFAGLVNPRKQRCIKARNRRPRSPASSGSRGTGSAGHGTGRRSRGGTGEGSQRGSATSARSTFGSS